MEFPILKITTTEENKSSPLYPPENEDDVIDKQSFSPSKYFGKRPSFEFKNLKQIEGKIKRCLSQTQYKDINNKEIQYDNVSSNNEMENSKVHFSGTQIVELTEEEKLASPDLKNLRKPKKSILKKTHFVEDIPLEAIFLEEINKEFIQKIKNEAHIEGKHFSEKLTKNFNEHWKNIMGDENKALLFLKGINANNIRFIFSEGIEFNTMISIINILKNNLNENMNLTLEFLNNFPTIRKFDIVASCFLPNEKNDIKIIIEKLSQNNIIDKKNIESLQKVYNI